jgi:hypothetical protein
MSLLSYEPKNPIPGSKLGQRPIRMRPMFGPWQCLEAGVARRFNWASLKRPATPASKRFLTFSSFNIESWRDTLQVVRLVHYFG